MNWISIGVASLAALGFYVASPHQAPWPDAPKRPLRWLAVLLCAGSVLPASAAYGFWCAVFIALSGLMLALVLLPCLHALMRGRHVD